MYMKHLVVAWLHGTEGSKLLDLSLYCRGIEVESARNKAGLERLRLDVCTEGLDE